MPGDDNARYQLFETTLMEVRQQKGLTQAEVAAKLEKPQSFVSKYEIGERRLDVIEFLEVCKALSANPLEVLKKLDPGTDGPESILSRWSITENDLTELVDHNPSLRGMVFGYVAEKKFHDAFLEHPAITEKVKDDDHARKSKGDRRIIYKGKTLTIEVKSLQTAMVKQLGPDKWSGKAQCDGSDRRTIKFPDGTELVTTCLLRGEFDLLAINCYAFGGKWRFVFAKNSDLPRSTYGKYSEVQRKQLIASLVPVTWPPETPFTEDPFALLDELLQEQPEVAVVEKTETAVVEQTVLEVKPT